MTVPTTDRIRPQRTKPVRRDRLQVALPQIDTGLPQDEEWCVVRIDGEWRQFRFHDYENIYKVPGLYERVIYDILECQSPSTVCNLLMEAIRKDGVAPDRLRVLDLGAGNGIVGKHLRDLGAECAVGVDIIKEASEASRRDRPDTYHA